MTPVPKILIVDDDPIAVKLLCKALAGMGELYVASSGADAVNRVARTSIDLVLLDVVMPEMDGFAMCRTLLQDRPDLPVIFMTAVNEAASEIRALQVGGRDFIGKPLNPPVVRARIDLHLRLKAQDAERQRVEKKLRGMTDAAHDAILMMNPQGAISFWNPAATALLGYTADEAIGKNLHDLLAPERYLPAHRAAFPEYQRRGRSIAMGRMVELAARRKDGQEIAVEVSLSAIALDDGWNAVGILRDLSERKRAEAALLRKEEELRSVREQLERTAFEVTENIPVGTYTMVLPPGAAMAQIAFMSRRFVELTGLDREETAGNPLQAFACVHPHDYAAWIRLHAQVFAEKSPFFGETRIVVGGEVRWIAAESIPRALPDGSTVWEGVLIDITERKRRERELEEAREALLAAKEEAEIANRALQAANRELRQLANTDALTGAWNRRRLEEAAANEMERLKRYRHPVSLIVLDIDFFKKINDLHGHCVGDQVLGQLAAVVRAALRPTDSLTRWGGEEFVVLAPNEPLDSAAKIAERLRETVARTDFPTVERVTMSVGVAECLPWEGWEQWFGRADSALYRAKAEGRNRVCTAPETPRGAGLRAAHLVQLHWQPAYACGHPLIDAQHRALFADTNRLLSAVLSDRPTEEVAGLIDTLVRNVNRHFEDEERIVAAAGYPDAAAHAMQHRGLVGKAGALVERFKAGSLGLGELFQFLSYDLVALHMLRSDRDYFPYLDDRQGWSPQPGQSETGDCGSQTVVD